MMKEKMFWFDVVVVIIVIAMMSAHVPRALAEIPSLGTITGPVSEVGRYCANKQDCTSTLCQTHGAEGSIKATSFFPTGVCQSTGWFTPSGPCASYAKCVCAVGKGYAVRNCVNEICDGLWTNSGGCY